MGEPSLAPAPATHPSPEELLARLSVGRSSRDLPITVTVTVGEAAEQRSATC